MLGFCWWDLPALIVLIAVIVYFAVRYSKMKHTQEELEDRISDLYEKDIQQ
jgi:archaellum component FlaF (FlaF/FlaG flagellin family)